jgi:thiamine pyrophosphate-dependent acetolactate synthase large subunit-like protein
MSSGGSEGGVARLIVRCLENEGVSHIFGIPALTALQMSS